MLLYSRRPLTSEAGVRSKANPSGLCGRESGIGTEFSPRTSIFPVNIIIPTVLYCHITFI